MITDKGLKHLNKQSEKGRLGKVVLFVIFL